MKTTLMTTSLKRSFPFLIIALFFFAPARAQFGPNLTAGSEGIVFGQGQLDAQVILGIIATKSGEVKKELGQRLILKKLEGGSYAFYHYAEKNLDVLFNEANKSVITKELMQNSAELLLVYGLAEYILQDIKAGRSHGPYDRPTARLLELLYREADSLNQEKISAEFFIKFTDKVIDSLDRKIKQTVASVDAAEKELEKAKDRPTREAGYRKLKELNRGLDKLRKLRNEHKNKLIENSYNQTNDSVSHIKRQTQQNPTTNGRYLLKPELITYLVNKENKDYNESSNDRYSGLSMFVDMIYDACIRNKYVNATGMFQAESKNSERYNALSKYLYFKQVSPRIYNDLTSFQPKVDSVINYLFQYYHLFIDFRSMIDQDMATFFKTLHNNDVFARIENKIDSTVKSDLRIAGNTLDSLGGLAAQNKRSVDSLLHIELNRFLANHTSDSLINYLSGLSVHDIITDSLPDTLSPEVQSALRTQLTTLAQTVVQNTGYASVKQQTDKLYKIALQETQIKKDTYALTALDTVLHETQDLLNKLRRDILLIGGPNCKNCSGGVYADRLDMQKKLLAIPMYIRTGTTATSAKEYLDLAYTLKKEYLPQLTALNLQQEGGVYNEVIDGCNRIMQNMNAAAYYYMVKDSSSINRLFHSLKYYIPLLEVINNLDRVESYDYMFKFLSEISETYGDPKSKMVTRMITNSLDKYSTLNKQENKISIDVEAIAKDIFAQFAENQHTAVYPFFSVGLNQNTALGNNLSFINDASDSAQSGSSQSSFVSEKIGVKWNVIDFNRKRSFNHYDLRKGSAHDRQKRAMKAGLQPAVNNVHAFAYASGILYQIKALNSADAFTTPVIGAGAGITFFNGLDLNLSYVLPVTFKTDQAFLCISFDIAIFQYLSALTQKNK